MSTSDLIAFFAVVVALQIGSLVFYFKITERLVESHERNKVDALENAFSLKMQHRCALNLAKESEAICALYGSLLVRLCDQCFPIDESLRGKVREAIGKFDEDYQKALQEFLLFSPVNVERDSAARELSQEYGNLDSLELIEELLRFRNDEQLSTARKFLKARLSRSLEAF